LIPKFTARLLLFVTIYKIFLTFTYFFIDFSKTLCYNVLVKKFFKEKYMKLVQLSLAAIMAAGAFTYASATPLTDAIKGVDLSGMLRLRMYNEDRGTNGTADYNRWRSSADFKFTIPVSDSIKVVYKLGVENDSYTNGNQNISANKAVPVTENFFFMNYKANNLNVLAGKLSPTTSITTGGHGENSADGVLALYNVGGGFTVAGAFLDQLRGGNVALGGADLGVLAGIYSSKMFSANAWYYRITNVAKYIYTVSATVTPMAGVSIGGDYAAGKLDAAGSQNHSFWNLFAGYKANGFDTKVGYAATNKKAGVIYQNVDSRFGEFVPAVQQRYGLANLTDMDVIYVKAGYNVMASTNIYAAYATVDQPGKANDSDEYIIGAKYKYNKKLGFHAYYDMLDYSVGNASDNNEFRFEAKYSF
jgi:hypothetical protein